MFKRDMINSYPNVTRVEVISESGREYVNWNCHSVQVSEQDEGRTIKIFLQNDMADKQT